MIHFVTEVPDLSPIIACCDKTVPDNVVHQLIVDGRIRSRTYTFDTPDRRDPQWGEWVAWVTGLVQHKPAAILFVGRGIRVSDVAPLGRLGIPIYFLVTHGAANGD